MPVLGRASVRYWLRLEHPANHLVVLLLCCTIEKVPALEDPRHVPGRGEVSGFYNDHFCPLTPGVGHLNGVAFDRAVVSLGVAEAFEGEGEFGHAKLQRLS